MHLFPEARPDPATHAPASFRKEGRFASSSVEGKDAKKCDKEVFKTPVHPSNLRVARRRTLPEPVHLPRLSVVATHHHVERLLGLERASATKNEREEVARERGVKQHQASGGLNQRCCGLPQVFWECLTRCAQA